MYINKYERHILNCKGIGPVLIDVKNIWIN